MSEFLANHIYLLRNWTVKKKKNVYFVHFVPYLLILLNVHLCIKHNFFYYIYVITTITKCLHAFSCYYSLLFSLKGISFLAKVDQHKICHLTIYNSNIFDDFKISPYESPSFSENFQIQLIFGRWPRSSKLHSLLLQSGGLLEIFHQKEFMGTQVLGSTLRPLD